MERAVELRAAVAVVMVLVQVRVAVRVLVEAAVLVWVLVLVLVWAVLQFRRPRLQGERRWLRVVKFFSLKRPRI